LKICTFEVEGRDVLGVVEGEKLVDVSSLGETFLDGLAGGSYVDVPGFAAFPRYPYRYESLRLPIRPDEIWGAGVTYLRSRDARETETKSKGVYEYLYSAVRPEVFIKGSGQRAVGRGEAISVRSDSHWTVPEPELGVVLTRDCRVLGYTIANDVSARDIEGENPLYLTQSKIYKNSCSIGPVVVTKDEVPDPHNLRISLRIIRRGEIAFDGATNTSRMKRTIDELLSYLRKDNVFFGWIVFMTGTGIVPPDDFALEDGDVVEIEMEKIGLLRNPVSKLRE
jgi:2-dehydro-3-deoxy-D-arabinonate dehydratase